MRAYVCVCVSKCVCVYVYSIPMLSFPAEWVAMLSQGFIRTKSLVVCGSVQSFTELFVTSSSECLSFQFEEAMGLDSNATADLIANKSASLFNCN